MKSKTLTQAVLVAALLVGGSILHADTNQADGTTTLKVKMALLEKLGTDSLHIDVDTTGGAVRLSGTVSKRATMELAETVAKSVTGVKDVKDDIHLAAIEANPSKAGAVVGEAESELKDAMLETKVRLALVDKMGSDGFKVGTEAASGVVTLEFEHAFSAALREQATQVVKGVEGVSKVVSVEKKA
jgi:osmotically-inducible protein OsmY